MLLLLIVEYLIVSFCWASYIPLRFTVIRPSELERFDDKIEDSGHIVDTSSAICPTKNSLEEAMSNLTGIISVLDYGFRSVSWETMRKCSKSFTQTKQVRVMEQVSATKQMQKIVNFNMNFELRTKTVVILIENNRKLCKLHQEMMASASPCAISNGTRPLLGVVNICIRRRWKRFQAGVDLFRHELLHSLGFGTLNPVSPSQKGPATVIYEWTDSWDRSSRQPAKRRFLDFAEEAVKEARKFLGCSKLAGVETDTADKIHLNEYIYGNELMTPTLSNLSNRFSYISAAILEGTFLGAVQWYRVNRSAIRGEHEALWYGKGWGCTFAERSCFDFIAERIGKERSTFPFCSEDDYRSGRTRLAIKVAQRKPLVRKVKCWSQALIPGSTVDNQIKAYPLFDKAGYSEKEQVGSPSRWRFCPIAKIFVEDQFDLPPKAILL